MVFVIAVFMKIIVLNVGSSTFKCALFDGNFSVIWEKKASYSSHTFADELKKICEEIPKGEIFLAGHRVVHGGAKYRQPVYIDDQVKKDICGMASLAPLHNPANLAGIEALQSLFPAIPHYAVFDTAFHTTMPDYASTYAIPEEWRRGGIQRYGFHGISHAFCSRQAAKLVGKPYESLKMITCHLGNGSSLAAIREGLCVDTSMGFTPMEGVVMGTRSGSIDPGILIYLLRNKAINTEELDHILNYESGLKGVSGHSDMKELLIECKQQSPNAILAYKMLVHSLSKHIGSMAAVLNGVDVVVFSGGIGENCPELRGDVCKQMSFMGMGLESVKNNQVKEDQIISTDESKLKIMVIHTKEELAIAQASLQL